MITEEAIIEIDGLIRDHWSLINSSKNAIAKLQVERERLNEAELSQRSPEASANFKEDFPNLMTKQDIEEEIELQGQVLKRFEKHNSEIQSILNIIGSIVGVTVGFPISEFTMNELTSKLSDPQFDVFLEDKMYQRKQGSKTATSRIYQLIEEKKEVIRLHKEEYENQEISAEWLKFHVTTHEDHIRSLTKIMWIIGKDETWSQEKNEPKTSSDDLKQCFVVLDSKDTDSPKEIKAKFRELIKFYHPDYFQNNPEKRSFAEKKTKELNDAFDKLHGHGIL